MKKLLLITLSLLFLVGCKQNSSDTTPEKNFDEFGIFSKNNCSDEYFTSNNLGHYTRCTEGYNPKSGNGLNDRFIVHYYRNPVTLELNTDPNNGYLESTQELCFSNHNNNGVAQYSVYFSDTGKTRYTKYKLSVENGEYILQEFDSEGNLKNNKYHYKVSENYFSFGK